ncbi:MAG: sulfite exporter TauE/SafE family protein [Candidatus Dormiibacterota bacterium]
MTVLQAAVVAGTGVLAGIANTIAGGGSLLSYPALLGVGLNPLAANVTNTVGLVPGLATGSHGYRAELSGQGARLIRLMVPMGLGGLGGTVLLLKTSPGIFTRVVPWLIIVGCLALFFRPALARLMGEHSGERSPVFRAGLVLLGIYGGYFGAAMSVMLLALLALYIQDTLQRLNAAKVVCTTTVNLIAAVGFSIFGPVSWVNAVTLAGGAVVGGLVGAALGRRIPPTALRYGVAAVGIGLAIKLLVAP